MTSEHDQLAAFRDRLNALERSNRHLRSGLIVAAMAGTALALLAATASPPTVLEARKLVIRDNEGRVRCQIEATDADGVVQSFVDKVGVTRVRILADQEGFARIRLMDSSGAVRVGLYSFPGTLAEEPNAAGIGILGYGNRSATFEKGGFFASTKQDGSTRSSLYDHTGKERVISFCNKDDNVAGVGVAGDNQNSLYAVEMGTRGATAYQVHTGSDGGNRLVSLASDGGKTGFSVLEGGRTRLWLGNTSSGVSRFAAYDRDGTMRLTSFVVPQGAGDEGIWAEGFASSLVFDNSGIPRIQLSTFADGSVTSNISDAAGECRFQTYVDTGATAIAYQYDASGNTRFLSGTYADGRVGTAFFGHDGVTKASTFVSATDAVSQYLEKSASEKAWESYKELRDAVQVLEDINTIGKALNGD